LRIREAERYRYRLTKKRNREIESGRDTKKISEGGKRDRQISY
jgi:hypothetical protein